MFRMFLKHYLVSTAVFCTIFTYMYFGWGMRPANLWVILVGYFVVDTIYMIDRLTDAIKSDEKVESGLKKAIDGVVEHAIWTVTVKAKDDEK